MHQRTEHTLQNDEQLNWWLYVQPHGVVTCKSQQKHRKQ